MTLLSGGHCYFPNCAVKTIVFVEGQPVFNLHFAHIRGAKRGSARWEEGMGDEERSSFSNLLLLCKPHHDLIDRIEPDRFDEATLLGWKREREAGRTAELARLDGITEPRLTELLESIVHDRRSQRVVAVELFGGALVAPREVLTLPIDDWETVLKLNAASIGRAERVVVATARNAGSVPASVEDFTLYFNAVDGDTSATPRLMRRDDYPSLNPSLPTRIEVGDPGLQWIVRLATVKATASTFSVSTRFSVETFGVEVRLGSGEVVHSDPILLAALPEP